jgi:Family of unknown function (DUF6084)
VTIEQAQTTPTAPPAPEFEIVGAAHVPFAASPTMLFEAVATEPSGAAIQSIALTAQVMIDPARRGYDPETRLRLTELFGPPASWAPSTSGLPWARVAAAVPGFTGESRFSLEVPCTYDLEVAAAKYFYAVQDGEVPLTFHFNGNVFYYSKPTHPPPAAFDGRLQVMPISWATSSQYRMPVAAWRAMIAEHYPGGGWIRISDETLRALHERRAARGLPSLDACVAELLEGSDG